MSSPHRRVQVDPEPRSHDLPPGPDLPLHPARSAHLEYYHVQSTTCAETQNTAVGLAMAAMEALLSLSPRHTTRKADVSRQPPRALTSREASLPTIAAPQHDTTAREACPKRHGWTRCNHGAVSARKKKKKLLFRGSGKQLANTSTDGDEIAIHDTNQDPNVA